MKRQIFLVLCLLLLGVFVIYSGYDKDTTPKLRLADRSQLEDVTITQKRDGILKWTLDAKKAVFQSDREVRLSDMRVQLPDKGLVLTAESGIYDMESRDFTIEGTVKASTDKFDIVSGALRWDADRSELHTGEQVTIVGKNFVVQGEDLVATTDRATLRKNVRVQFNNE